MKEVKRYLQTFHGRPATGALFTSAYNFQFTRIFKESQSNKFIIRVTNLATYQAITSNIPHAVFAVGLDGNSSCDYITADDTQNGLNPYSSNDFCLGVLGNNNAGATTGWNNNEILLNDIPWKPFTMRYKHLDQYNYETGLDETNNIFLITGTGGAVIAQQRIVIPVQDYTYTSLVAMLNSLTPDYTFTLSLIGGSKIIITKVNTTAVASFTIDVGTTTGTLLGIAIGSYTSPATMATNIVVDNLAMLAVMEIVEVSDTGKE